MKQFKFSMKSKMEEILNDERAVEIIRHNFPFVMNHPRFIEAYEYSLEEIINDDMGQIVGIPKKKVKQVFGQIMELD